MYVTWKNKKVCYTEKSTEVQHVSYPRLLAPQLDLRVDRVRVAALAAAYPVLHLGVRVVESRAGGVEHEVDWRTNAHVLLQGDDVLPNSGVVGERRLGLKANVQFRDQEGYSTKRKIFKFSGVSVRESENTRKASPCKEDDEDCPLGPGVEEERGVVLREGPLQGSFQVVLHGSGSRLRILVVFL